jgi:hypothetical protein
MGHLSRRLLTAVVKMQNHLARHNVDFYKLGFSNMFEPVLYKSEFIRESNNLLISMLEPYLKGLSKMYPTYIPPYPPIQD